MADIGKAKDFASTLRFVAETGRAAGLIPDKVREAAVLIVEQAKRIAELEATLASKHHAVTVKAEKVTPYRVKLSARYVIASPVVYEAELLVDLFRIVDAPPTFLSEYGCRALARNAIHNWENTLAELAYREFARIDFKRLPDPGEDNG